MCTSKSSSKLIQKKKSDEIWKQPVKMRFLFSFIIEEKNNKKVKVVKVGEKNKIEEGNLENGDK